MSKIIIGIHGLQNKPSADLLEVWWKKSISEGLWAVKRPHLSFNFKLSYWAQFLYPAPLDEKEKDLSSPFYVKTPYTRAVLTVAKEPSFFRRLVYDKVLPVFENLAFNKTRYFNLDVLGHYIIRKRFKDLYYYYHTEPADSKTLDRPVKEVIRNALAALLIKYRKKDIMIIAHSMGAIIAYDVLTGVVPDIKIHTLVTVGAPLGMPLIKKEILDDQQDKNNFVYKTPENVYRNWYDFADTNDNITINHDLHDDYEANTHGVRVQNKLINNDYSYQGVSNPHKVYGYLRTPELANIIADFLSEGHPDFFNTVRIKIITSLFKKKNKGNKEEEGKR